MVLEPGRVRLMAVTLAPMSRTALSSASRRRLKMNACALFFTKGWAMASSMPLVPPLTTRNLTFQSQHDSSFILPLASNEGLTTSTPTDSEVGPPRQTFRA